MFDRKMKLFSINITKIENGYSVEGRFQPAEAWDTDEERTWIAATSADAIDVFRRLNSEFWGSGGT